MLTVTYFDREELHYVLCFIFYDSIVCLCVCLCVILCVVYVDEFYAWSKLLLCYAMLCFDNPTCNIVVFLVTQ